VNIIPGAEHEKSFIYIGSLFLILQIGASRASAGTGLEIVVRKLEEKGILTQYESQIILEETKRELARELSEVKSSTAPKWTQKVTVKGDLRHRQEFNWEDNDNRPTRYRHRIRARLALNGKVNEEVEGGMRFVSGNTSPISTNQTLGDFFGTKGFMLDRGYIKYTPHWLDNHVDGLAGMFVNPFYHAELLWDSDVSFGGMAAAASINSREIPGIADIDIPDTDFFGAAGAFPLDDLNGTWEDPWL